MLTFAKFANAVIYATKQGNEIVVNALLRCVYDATYVPNGKGGQITYAEKEICSYLVNGKRDVHLEIQRSTGEQKVIDGAEDYFSKEVVPTFIPSLLDDFLDAMKKSIAADASMSEAKRTELLSLANKKTLAKFLASVCLYVINKPNTVQTEGMAPNNLPKRNQYFSGRAEQLESIDALFKKDKKDAVSICHTVSGLGGVGKTQLAIEYAYRYHSGYKTFIWFVSAESPTTVYNYFRDFAEEFKLVLPPDFKPEDLQRAVKAWLSENQSWLLIFDNIETMDAVTPYLPSKINGRIIITTRSTRIDYGVTLELGVFDLDESIAFLKRRFSDDDDLKMEHYGFDDFDAQASALATRLGCLPLALEQAAAYIKIVKCSIESYLQLLGQSSVDAFSDKYATPQYYEDIVTSTWNISFQALEESSRQLMNLCAYMAPDRIPVDFFVEMREKLPDPLKTNLTKKQDTNRVVTGLRDYSLTSGNAEFINIHRLVQEVVRKSHEVSDE